jgi:hypothetical protein
MMNSFGPFTKLEIACCALTAAILSPSTGFWFFDLATGWITYGMLLTAIFWIKYVKPRH